jgi:trans-aconitate 2-methyltransferase
MRVLERLAPAAGERILDIGCGTGRLTGEILARAPSAQVIAIDRSAAMLSEATRQSLRLPLARAEATGLPFTTGFDAVFSTATFHWVADHPRLFSEVHRVLAPGGRLVAQAGGGPNLETLLARASRVAQADWASRFAGWRPPWNFAGPDDTRARLAAAGFGDIRVWLEPAPTTFADANAFSEFVSTVCLRHHLERLDRADRRTFVQRIASQAAHDDPPFTLDYWRLNIDARKG